MRPQRHACDLVFFARCACASGRDSELLWRWWWLLLFGSAGDGQRWPAISTCRAQTSLLFFDASMWAGRDRRGFGCMWAWTLWTLNVEWNGDEVPRGIERGHLNTTVASNAMRACVRLFVRARARTCSFALDACTLGRGHVRSCLVHWLPAFLPSFCLSACLPAWPFLSVASVHDIRVQCRAMPCDASQPASQPAPRPRPWLSPACTALLLFGIPIRACSLSVFSGLRF